MRSRIFQTGNLSRTALRPSWDVSCETSLRVSRGKALAAGTKEALAAFEARLVRLYDNTAMPVHVFVRHLGVVDTAWLRLDLNE